MRGISLGRPNAPRRRLGTAEPTERSESHPKGWDPTDAATGRGVVEMALLHDDVPHQPIQALGALLDVLLHVCVEPQAKAVTAPFGPLPFRPPAKSIEDSAHILQDAGAHDFGDVVEGLAGLVPHLRVLAKRGQARPSGAVGSPKKSSGG